MRTALLAAGLGVAAIAALSACSSSSSDSASASPSASPSASAAATAEVLPPVIVTQDATTAEAKVGDFVVFNVADPAGTTISTPDTAIFEVTQGYSDGSATYNPGGTALQNGTATLTITEPNLPARTVVLTIS